MSLRSYRDGDLNKTGVLLINVGTPDEPRTREVRTYLSEFLSDPRVLDINPIVRWLLLHLIILRKRPAESAEAYQKIWLADGSPLLVHSKALVAGIQHHLGSDYKVVPAMRYGNPSITVGLNQLRDWGADRLVIFPLYPHYASSSTGTSLEKVFDVLKHEWCIPSVSIVPPFYDHPDLIQSFVESGQPVIDQLLPDHHLFSFHGLPERHVQKTDLTGEHCSVKTNCCAELCPINRNCYRAQCYVTARLIARRMDLGENSWSVSFQSRLGRDPWIRPYTDERVVELAQSGVKRMAVFCPAFVSDCLETIEEIGMRARDDFLEHGGEDLQLIPSLNSNPVWIKTATNLVRQAAWDTSGCSPH